MEILMAYLHYVAIIGIAGTLVAELVACRPGMTAEQARRIATVDLIFFGAAMLALATGLLRLFLYAKGWRFYAPNPFFVTKMALYVAIALISVGPTRQFLRWRRVIGDGGPPPSAADILAARRLIHVELALLVLMPLMAVLMARGVGR